jgi:hypothetical protein
MADLTTRSIVSPDGAILITIQGKPADEVNRLAHICANAPAALVMLRDMLAWAEKAHEHEGCHMLTHARETVALSEGKVSA